MCSYTWKMAKRHDKEKSTSTCIIIQYVYLAHTYQHINSALTNYAMFFMSFSLHRKLKVHVTL